MKIFDDDEKLIIKKILERSGLARNLINIFDSRRYLQGVRIQLDNGAKGT